MRELLEKIVFSNPVKSYLAVVLAILFALVVKRVLSRFIAGQLFRAATTLDAGLDKTVFVSLLLGPMETFLVVFISIVAIEKLKYPAVLEFEIYEVSFRSVVHALAKMLLIATFIWMILRMIDFVALLLKRKARAAGDLKDHSLVVFFRDFLKAILIIIGFLMIMGMAFHFNVGNLWTGLGLAGAALALATKESIENLIASFIIFFDKPFMAGDVLKVNNITGTVEKIGLRSTRIRTELKTYVTVPNKQMVDSIVDNQTLRTQRKAEIRLQIDTATPVGTIQQFITGVKQLLTKTYIESPSVFLMEISGTAFQVNIDYFTPPIAGGDFNQIKEKINMEILNLLAQCNISLAGSSTTVKLVQAETSVPGGTGEQ